MKKAAPPPVYPFELDIEKALVLASCEVPRFYQAVGRVVDPERLRDPAARLIMAAVHTISKKTGSSPTWASVPIQHLATLMFQGKVTFDQLEGAKDYLLDAAMLKQAPADELIAITAPVLQRVLHKEAIVEALDDFKNHGDPGDASLALDQVSKIGKTNDEGGGFVNEMITNEKDFEIKKGDLLKFGIPELDDAIGGGMEKRALGLLVGGSGAGKSMALAHVGVEAMFNGEDVFYVTLELSQLKTSHRMIRNMIDMTKRETSLDPSMALKRIAAVQALPGIGKLYVKYMEPLITSPRDIRKALDEAMREKPGFNPKVIIVDFMDKLRVNQRSSLYEDMLAVADGLRSIAADIDGWCWTASQSDRTSTNRPWLDLDAVADSMNKIRSADVVIAIGRTDEDKEQDMVRFSVPKRREGEGAHARIGPMSWDPEHGRIAVINHRILPW